jgi:hypothetical protein
MGSCGAVAFDPGDFDVLVFLCVVDCSVVSDCLVPSGVKPLWNQPPNLRTSGRRVAHEAAVMPRPGSMVDQMASHSIWSTHVRFAQRWKWDLPQKSRDEVPVAGTQ